jgi:hypothetical protein
VGSSKLVIMPGLLRLAYKYELERLREDDALSRLWSKDTSLWPVDKPRGGSHQPQLDWLDLPGDLLGYAQRAARTAEEIDQEFDDVVFVALGSSNLAAELVSSMALFAYGKRFLILDSIHPSDIRTIESVVEPARTLFLLVSKTGKLIETHVLFLYFLERLKSAGISRPGQQFIGVTEEDSYLRDLSGQYQFRKLFVDPPGFPSRFSGVIHFTLLLSALCKQNPESIIEHARAMRQSCMSLEATADHPAASLASFLAAGAEEGYDRLAFLTHPKLQPIANRLGQLVGTSTCAEGRGILPLFDATPGTTRRNHGKYMAVFIRMAGLNDPELDQAAEEWAQTGAPCLSMNLESVEELGARLYQWEIAVCLACALLGVNPFEARDMAEARALAMEYLERMTQDQAQPERKARMEKDGIELYAEGSTRHEISMLSVKEGLRNLFLLSEADGYLAMLSYLPELGQVHSQLEKLRKQIEAVVRVPVLLNQGPRYLHGAGQSYKGGPAKGTFLMLTEETEKDIAVPGADYTFGDLGMALALADFDVLTRRNRPVVRLHMRRGTPQKMEALQNTIQQALVGIRRRGE